MSIQGIGPAGVPQWLRAPETAGGSKGTDGAEVAREQPAGVQSSATRGVAPPSPALAPPSGGAPDGVDAELWSLLTTEERGHFARFAAMGGVTYGPRSENPSPPLARGHRLDLRI